MDTVRAATEALRRQRFAQQVSTQVAALRQSEQAWSEYLAEAEATAVSDGLD